MLLGNGAIHASILGKEIFYYSEKNPEPKLTPIGIEVHLGENFYIKNSVGYFDKINLTKDYITFKPGFTYLGHTEEFVGSMVKNLTPFIQTKSTLAREGVNIITSAGYGSPGFTSRWTLEITNVNPGPFKVKIGSPIALISFTEVKWCDDLYAQTGYNLGPNEWTEKCLLPKGVY